MTLHVSSEEKLIRQGPEAGKESGRTLRDYSRLKLELAGILRSSKRLAEERKDEAKARQCQKLLVRLAEDRFNLAVVGQFSRGKSSLMNAILGGEHLPTGVLPVTSVITTVSYGDRERVMIHWKRTSYPSAVPLSDLARYVTQDGNPGNKACVEVAEVQLPVELLRLGFYFIDTPGVGSAIAANTATTTDFLPEADAVVFITSFESPLAESELRLLEQVRHHVRKIFLVINKRDLIAPEQQEKVLAFTQERLREVFGEAAPRVFPVSARDALRAKLSGEKDQLVRSGLPELEAALLEFLKTDKAHEFLRRIGDRTMDILERQAVDLQISGRLSADREKLKTFEERLTARIADLQCQREAVLQELRSRLCRELPKQFEPELDSLVNEMKLALVGQMEQDLDSPPFWQRWLEPEEGDAAQDGCQELLSRWLAELQPRVEQQVQDLAHAEVQQIADSLAELSQFGAEQAGSTLPQADGKLQLEELLEGIPVSFRGVQPDRWRFTTPWWLHWVPKAFAISRGMPRLLAHLAKFRDQTRMMFGQAVEDWVERLASKSGSLIENVATAQREMLDRQVHPDEIVALEQLRSHLQQVLAALGMLETRNTKSQAWAPPELGEVPSSDLGVRCFVCVQVEAALFDFMRRRQYELSKSASDQLEHAEHGGFCALHTWQYEAIASPQGICSAYPQVLSSLARKLRALAEAPWWNAYTDGLQEILPQPRTCAACGLMVVVERQAARDVLAACSSTSDEISRTLPALCLRHLSSVLMAKPDPELARLLIQEQARVLERIGEDMQRYSLKREALRGHLASEQEKVAHRTGLSRLVGLRTIVAPWKPGDI